MSDLLISLTHHIIVQCIRSRIFSTRPNLRMACKAWGHTMNENTKARHWIAAHYVSITQPKHWQIEVETTSHAVIWVFLWCILAALHNCSLGCYSHLCKAALHALWETCTEQSRETGCKQRKAVSGKANTVTQRKLSASAPSSSESPVKPALSGLVWPLNWKDEELLLLSTLFYKYSQAILQMQL